MEPKESEIQVSELPETPGKQIEYDSQFPTAQQDEDAQSAADTSEELQVEGSTRDVSQFSSTDQPERVMDRTTGIDLSPESLESNETVIGWKQLAGETLLQQIRTVLAGIGFLAVVVQLARR